jgi:hypothetical protein
MRLSRRHALAVLLIGGPSSARILHDGNAAAPSSAWHDLNVGGGGNVTGMDIHADGTFVHWGDVFGGWISNVANAGSNGNWQQLFTAASMPNTNYPRTFWSGAYYVKIAPSNSNTLVAMFGGNVNANGGAVMISRNKGATWVSRGLDRPPKNPSGDRPAKGFRAGSISYHHTVTPLSGITSSVQNPNGKADTYYTGMIVFNPTDDSEFYVGVPQSGGLWHCTSYGASCTRLDPGTIPSATGSFGYYGMSWLGSNIIIPVYGTGAYISTNGSAGPFSASSGAPTTIHSGGYASDGTYFCLNQQGQSGANVYRRTTGGTWSQIGPGTQWWSGLARDPNDKDHLATIDFTGHMSVATSATGTPSWQAVNGTYTITNGDTPWVGWSFNGNFSFLNANNCAFDGNGKFWVAMGVGVVYASSLPSSGATSYTPMNQGEEGLQANWARWVPNGPVLLSSWDRPGWVISNPNATQSTYAPDNSVTIRYGESIDYAQNNSSFFVMNAAGSLYYTSNGGTSWTASAVQPLSNQHGSLCVLSSTQWITADGNNGNISVTANGGGSWTTTPTGLTAGAFAGGVNAHMICWDSVTAGKAYAVSTAGTVFVTTNYGASWSQASSTGVFGSTGAGRIKSVVGKVGHLVFSYGNPGTAPGAQPPSTTTHLMFSSNGGANWTAVTNANFLLTCSFDVATTPAAPGQSYPSIAVYAWMKTASTGGRYVLDVWRCDNFDPASPASAGMVWTEMNWTQVAQPCCLEGNPSAYNQWVIANNAPSSALGWQYYGPASATW